MKKVLVIEDNPDIRELLVRQLTAAAYATEVLKNGWEAVEYLMKKKGAAPDAVVLDLMLPGRSGVELLNSIRSTFSWAKILVFSGHKESGSLIPKYCVDGFVSKAEGTGAVIRELNKLFGLSKPTKT